MIELDMHHLVALGLRNLEIYVVLAVRQLLWLSLLMEHLTQQ